MMLSEESTSGLRRAVRRTLPWILLVTVLGNVAMTAAFYRGSSHSLQLSVSGDLADLVDSTYPEMRQEYGVYAELARVAGGSRLAVPTDRNPFDEDRLTFLAGVEIVDGPWYPEQAAVGLHPTVTDLMWIGDGTISYSIVAGDPGEPYGGIRSDAGILIAPVRLLEGVEG